MKYYIGCEFDGRGGPLLSMALVSETGKSMYAVMGQTAYDPWVVANVVPIYLDVPLDRIDGPVSFGASTDDLPRLLEYFFAPDIYPHVIADWPDDIKYFMEALITGPGTMINVPGMKCSVKRVDAYPTTLPGAIQYNAWWDAMALRHMFMREAEVQS